MNLVGIDSPYALRKFEKLCGELEETLEQMKKEKEGRKELFRNLLKKLRLQQAVARYARNKFMLRKVQEYTPDIIIVGDEHARYIKRRVPGTHVRIYPSKGLRKIPIRALYEFYDLSDRLFERKRERRKRKIRKKGGK